MEAYTFCIVGRAGSGKTPFLERLIPLLDERGLKVASLKTSGRPLQLEYPLSDSARIARAGTGDSYLLTPSGLCMFSGRRHSLEEALEKAASGADILLVEGTVLEDHPTIEVVRAGLPSFPDDQVWLSVSHKPTGRSFEVSDAEAAAEEIYKLVQSSSPCAPRI